MLIIMKTILWVILQWIMFEKKALVQQSIKIATHVDNIKLFYRFSDNVCFYD